MIRRHLLRFAFAAVAILVVAFTSGWAGASGRDASRPTTLITAKEGIDGFAWEGDSIVWAHGEPNDLSTCQQVMLRSLSTGRDVSLGNENTLGDSCDLAPFLIALSGNRAVWGGYEDCCHGGYGYVATAAPGSRQIDLENLGQSYHDINGDFLTDLTGDGQTVVYAVVTIQVVNPDCDYTAKPCPFKLTHWKIRRVAGRKAFDVPNAPPATSIAVSGELLADAPTVRPTAASCRKPVTSCWEPNPTAKGLVEIRNLKTGTLRARFAGGGQVSALALSQEVAAVIVRPGHSARLEYYTLRGRKLGSLQLPGSVSSQLAVSGPDIVFAAGRTIRLLDANTGRWSVLAVAGAAPFDISIDRNAVVWAENSPSVGRIRMLPLPGTH